MGENDHNVCSARPWTWRLLAAVLILGTVALRLIYLAYYCPLDLAPDEAHYWDWSRNLDWSYYSKGPAVAFLIRAGCEVAGPFSLSLTGTEMVAVRLPAVLCGSLLLVALYILTVQVTRSERLATALVAAALTLPLIAAGSSLMTIDAPFTCFWAWALVLGHRAIFGGSAWAWPLTGLMVGAGILAKQTMVLWPVSLGLFLLFSPQHRRLLCRPGFWALCGTAALACLPILIWNANHDWVTFRHLRGLAGLGTGSAGVRWWGPLVYLGTQLALLLGIWFIVWGRAMLAHAPWREGRPQLLYLWWLSAPMFLVFLLFSFKTGGGEPNWPVAAYLSGSVLAGLWLEQDLSRSTGWYRRLALTSTIAACLMGLGVTLFAHFSSVFWPQLAALAGPPSSHNGFPLRGIDPTCRLRGWRVLAAQVDRLRAQLRREGIEPVLAASGWSLPGEIGFYCQGQPVVYSLGLALGDRRSQYDFWRPNPVWDPETFRGRTFLFISTGRPPILESAFARLDPDRQVLHVEEGQPIAAWQLTVCRGYRGFGPVHAFPSGTRY